MTQKFLFLLPRKYTKNEIDLIRRTMKEVMEINLPHGGYMHGGRLIVDVRSKQ